MNAKFYEKKGLIALCKLCPHGCQIEPGKSGICKVRQNIDGRLTTKAKPFPGAIDPIEKKPLYHFHPGEHIFSIGTVGCNLRCRFCQNWHTSMASPDDIHIKEICIEEIANTGCSMIAFTYNEPTVYYEYMLKVSKLSRSLGKKNVIVSNGYINPKPLKELCGYIDAANIDLKAFDEEFYKTNCNGTLKPVLNSLKIIRENGVWLEVTNLIIPGLNDDLDKIREMCKWIVKNLGDRTPLHFSAFYPNYRLQDLPPTSEDILLHARNTAKREGLKYVYIGNLRTHESGTTFCPQCHKKVIEREGYEVEINMKKGKCSCGAKVDGVF